VGEILKRIVQLLPPGWQYPEITHGQIVLDDETYQTDGFVETPWMQTADILVNDTPRGHVHVVYSEEKPVLDEGPFLNEERKLITAIARQVAIIVEHYEGLDEKIRLQEQLRHADRLATIGQLAAGVAHELNEPLANILGFAQLALKDTGVPKQAESDLQKIVESSLYAKDVIQKLLIFARQTPPSKTVININETITSALSFFKKRFTEKSITLHLELNPDLPEIVADKAQLTQVIINLCVNAIQAMSFGGDLTITTSLHKEKVQIVIEDNGIGMSEDVRKRIFLPFFTTKDVDQGTGLGLAVVHGIISAHKGSIEVESKVDEGTRFSIRLPVDSGTIGKDKQNGK
jgi:signal transduction histidine kinase